MRKIEGFNIIKKRNFLSTTLEKTVKESVLVRSTIGCLKLGSDYVILTLSKKMRLSSLLDKGMLFFRQTKYTSLKHLMHISTFIYKDFERRVVMK